MISLKSDNFQTKCVWTPSNTWQDVGYEGQFKVRYENYNSGCMPWKHNSLKFYVEQAISSIPSIQRVELVESYSEDIGNMHIIKFVIQFRSPTTGLQPFDVPFDETLGIAKEIEQPQLLQMRPKPCERSCSRSLSAMRVNSSRRRDQS